MKELLLASVAVTALALLPPAAQASIISIDDLTDSLVLTVALPGAQTNPGDAAPGSGNVITGNSVPDGISDFFYDAPTETLSFTFANHLPWGSDVYLYRYFTEAGGGNSDLFVIQGFAGQNPDHVTFISDSDPASLSGNPLALVPVMAGSSASPSDLGTLAETGDWQLAENTNPDQYYIQSDIPEPATMAVLGVSFLGLGFARRKRG